MANFHDPHVFDPLLGAQRK